MDRIQTSTKAVDKFGAGKHGFTAGNPATGTPATQLSEILFDSVQEEICAPIEAAGIALDPNNRAQLLQALRSAGVFQTPDQFDNTSKAATTAFVRTHLGMLRGENAYGTATTLTAADIGKEIYLIGSSSYTITLPLISASPAGSTIVFFSAANTSITIQRQGTDTIAGLASSTSVVIGVGDTLYLVSNGAAWVAYGGSAQIGSAAAFGSSLSGNGYQKLPSGLIVQWGGVTSSPSADVTWTFPIAFTTGMYVCVGTNANGAGSLPIVVSTGASTLTGVAVGAYTSNTGARASATACQMLAVGK